MIEIGQRRLEPQRVFCIGVNYAAHQAEMGETDADRCVIFMKPATSLVAEGAPIRLPRGRGPVHHEVELVVAIGSAGSAITAERALDHVAGITVGLDLTLRAVQQRLKTAGHPWELAKAFDQSAPLGRFLPFDETIDLANLPLRCEVNGERRQDATTARMLFPVQRLIAILSRTWALLPGDLIFTGTPEGVGPLEAGDEAVISSDPIGRFRWRFE